MKEAAVAALVDAGVHLGLEANFHPDLYEGGRLNLRRSICIPKIEFAVNYRARIQGNIDVFLDSVIRSAAHANFPIIQPAVVELRGTNRIAIRAAGTEGTSFKSKLDG